MNEHNSYTWLSSMEAVISSHMHRFQDAKESKVRGNLRCLAYVGLFTELIST